MNHPLVLCLISALGFGIWPIIARFSGMSATIIAVAASLGTFLGVAAGIRYLELGGKTPWSTAGVTLCLAAGLANAFGFLAYCRLLNERAWDLTKYIPLSFGLMITVAALGGVVIFGEALTAKKVAGICLVVLSAWFLK